MYDCYCKNCNSIIRKWDYKYTYYNVINYCNYIKSKNCNSIFFLDCKNCNQFVGLECWDVCKICFGKYQIFEEKKLFNWFQKYKKIITSNYNCKICNKNDFRRQFWLFEELTFYK